MASRTVSKAEALVDGHPNGEALPLLMDEEVMRRVHDLFAAHGADIWFEKPDAFFLPADAACAACGGCSASSCALV